MANETSTYMTFLMHEVNESMSKLCDIVDYSDLGSEPETIEVTTLSDRRRRFIDGLQNTEKITFTLNYTPAVYKALLALKGKLENYAVWLGGTESGEDVTPTGSNGKFSFSGYLSVFKTGGGTSEAQQMTVSITVTSDIEFSES